MHSNWEEDYIIIIIINPKLEKEALPVTAARFNKGKKGRPLPKCKMGEGFPSLQGGYFLSCFNDVLWGQWPV